MINQWLNYWGDALPSIDFDVQWKETQGLLRQGARLYDACMTYSLARLQPDTWADAAVGISRTLAAAAENWMDSSGFTTGNTNSADSEALAALQKRLDETESSTTRANTEITTLKRSLTLQKKSLAKQIEFAEDSRKAAVARDKQIGDLENEVRRLTTMLNQLDKKTK